MRRSTPTVQKRRVLVVASAAAGLLAACSGAANAGTPKTIVAFTAPGPGQPLLGLVAGPQGVYYGVEFGSISLSGPGAPFPSVFSLSPKGALGHGWQAALIPVTVSAALQSPIANLTVGRGGVLFGSATLNGCIVLSPGFTFPCEAVVALTPPAAGQTNWASSVVGHLPAAGTGITGLVLAPSGALIGTASDNTVFQLTPPAADQTGWATQTLYTFTGGADGGLPFGRLLLDSAGAIYGTSYQGGNAQCGASGTAACGTIFRLNPPAVTGRVWTETTLYSGSAGPVQVSFLQNGALYGVDQAGCCGAVVKIAPGSTVAPWVLSNLASFAGGADGTLPTYTGLTEDSAGLIFGTTAAGGQGSCPMPSSVTPPLSGCGVIFKLKPTAKGTRKTTLWSFTGGADGGGPLGGLVQGPAGELLGVTYSGGAGGLGTVYRLPVPVVQP